MITNRFSLFIQITQYDEYNYSIVNYVTGTNRCAGRSESSLGPIDRLGARAFYLLLGGDLGQEVSRVDVVKPLGLETRDRCQVVPDHTVKMTLLI